MAETYEVKVRPEKVEATREIAKSLSEASAIVLTEYRGLTVGEIGRLRRELSKADVAYRVIKNTLARRAATDVGIEGLDGLFVGPTAIAYCFGDPVSAARTLSDFAKDHPALVIKGTVFEGRVMSADETEELARVDPLDVSLGKILGLLQAPLQHIVGILEAPLSRILYVLEQGVAQGAAGPFSQGAPAETPNAPAAEATADEAPAAEEAAEATAETPTEEPPADGEEAAADGDEGGA